MKAVRKGAWEATGQEMCISSKIGLCDKCWNRSTSRPLRQVIVQLLKCKPSWIWVWIVNILYAGGETTLFTLLSLFPRQNQWSWCEAETQQVVIAWAGFRNFLLQMNCQYIEETSKDSTLEYWWVQRGKTKAVYRGLCFWQWFFVLDSLVGVLWWLINPLG